MPVVDANHHLLKKKNLLSIMYITNDRCDCEAVAYVRWISGALLSAHPVPLYDAINFIYTYIYIYTYVIEIYICFLRISIAREEQKVRETTEYSLIFVRARKRFGNYDAYCWEHFFKCSRLYLYFRLFPYIFVKDSHPIFYCITKVTSRGENKTGN